LRQFAALSPHLARLFRTFPNTCRLLRELADFCRVNSIYRAISARHCGPKRTLGPNVGPSPSCWLAFSAVIAGLTTRRSHKANGAGIAADPTLTGAWSRLQANLPTVAWRPMFPRLLPKEEMVRSPALAPASAFTRGLARPKTCPRLAKPKARRSLLVFHLRRKARLPRQSRVPSMADRIAQPALEHPSRSSQAALLTLAEAFANSSSKTARTVSTASFGSEKAFVFKSFDRQSKSSSFPSDVLRLRSRSESGKHCKAELSTSPRFRGGQGWVTQRFVARRPDPLSDPASQAGEAAVH